MTKDTSLREKALRATKGPWFARGRYIGTKNHMSFVGECRDINGNWCDDAMASANGAYIAAADPQTILALLDASEANRRRIEALEAAAAKAQKALAAMIAPEAIKQTTVINAYAMAVAAEAALRSVLSSQEPEEASVLPMLHLIDCFCDDMTERNWDDKRLYIKQQVGRVRAALSGKEGQS